MQRENRGEEEHLLTRGEALCCCNDIEVLPCPAGLQPLGLYVNNQAVSGMFVNQATGVPTWVKQCQW